MTKTDEIILKEIRELRKSVENNFIIIHQKVDDTKTELNARISLVDGKVDGYNTKFLVFKAKFAVVGAMFVAIGNSIPYVPKLIEYIKTH